MRFAKPIMVGLLVGALAALLGLGYVFQSSNKIVFETDQSKTLGHQAPELSDLQKAPLSADDLAKRLGLKDGAQALAQAQVLAERVTGGFLPPGWKEECVSKYSKPLCLAVDDYFNLQGEVLGLHPRSPRHRTPPFDLRRLRELQSADFNSLLPRAPDWSWTQLERFAAASLKTTDCPRTFSLVLARKLEPHLEDAASWELFDKLHTHGLECVKPDDAWAEFVFLRAGLFLLAREKTAEALPYLEKAAAATQRREEYRTLYWLLHAYEKAGRKDDAQKARNSLYEKYPISWHTILTKVEAGEDPFLGLQKVPLYADEVESGNQNANQRMWWLHLLLKNEEAGFAAKRYGEFVVRSLDAEVSPGVFQYLARSFDRVALYRLQIIALNQVNINRPKMMTLESLRLLYPKPFMEEFSGQAKHMDIGLLLGLARQESSFDPTLTSNRDARGLLQILPSTARTIQKIKKGQLYDYARNIEIGSQYVLRLVDQFSGSVEKSLAAYNAGQGVVRRWETQYRYIPDVQLFLDIIPYRETRDYVPSILRNAYWYHRLFPEMTAQLGAKTVTSGLLRLQLFPSQDKAQASTAKEAAAQTAPSVEN